LNFIVLELLGVPLFIAAATVAYGVTQPPFPVCYVEGVGEHSCGASRNLSSDSEPEVQLIEWCWLSTENHLIWAMVLPAIIVLSVSWFARKHSSVRRGK